MKDIQTIKVISTTSGIKQTVSLEENKKGELVEKERSEERVKLTTDQQGEVLDKLLKGRYWNPELVDKGLSEGKLELNLQPTS